MPTRPMTGPFPRCAAGVEATLLMETPRIARSPMCTVAEALSAGDLRGHRGRTVDGYGEAPGRARRAVADGRCGGEPDHAVLRVDDGTARVAGLDGGGDLDHVRERLAVAAAAVGRGHLLAERDDGPGLGARGATDAVRVPDDRDRVAGPGARGIAETRGLEAVRIDEKEHREVVGDVVAADTARRTSARFRRPGR